MRVATSLIPVQECCQDLDQSRDYNEVVGYGDAVATTVETPPAPATHTALMRSLRERSVSALLVQLRRDGPSARKQLGSTTGMSSTSITRLTALLVGAGVLVEHDPTHDPQKPGRAGRRETPLDFAPGGRLAVGVHLRGRATTCAVVDLTGAVLTSAEVAHEDLTPEAVLAEAVALAGGLLAELPAGRVLGIGVSLGGVVDRRRRLSLDFPVLGWHDVPIGPAFDSLGLPVHVESSVRALALAQLWRPTSRSDETALTVLVAGVVGAALVVDGQLLRGPGGAAANVRHLPVREGPGERCDCGRLDCLGHALGNRTLRARAVTAGLAPAGVLWSDDCEPVEGPFDRVGLGRLRAERARWLGEAVGNLVEILDPDRVVVTGSVGSASDVRLCLEVARARCAGTMAGQHGGLSYTPVTPQDSVGAAATLVVDDYLRRPLNHEPALI